MPESKVKSLLAQEVDPRKAVATVDLELIDSVAALDQEKKCVCVCEILLSSVSQSESILVKLNSLTYFSYCCF